MVQIEKTNVSRSKAMQGAIIAQYPWTWCRNDGDVKCRLVEDSAITLLGLSLKSSSVGEDVSQGVSAHRGVGDRASDRTVYRAIGGAVGGNLGDRALLDDSWWGLLLSVGVDWVSILVEVDLVLVLNFLRVSILGRRTVKSKLEVEFGFLVWETSQALLVVSLLGSITIVLVSSHLHNHGGHAAPGTTLELALEGGECGGVLNLELLELLSLVLVDNLLGD